MKRRRLMTAAIAGGAALVAGGSGLVWFRAGNSGEMLTVAAALQKIDDLSRQKIHTTGSWNPHQVFSHCAQTIEYSMSAYPAPKSALFQDTAGKLAFAVFSSREKMMHGLSEPIAGAPVLERSDNVQDGLSRLRQAFIKFQQFNGVLAPHFAYGALSKHEYELAHVMHFWNHMDEITV